MNELIVRDTNRDLITSGKILKGADAASTADYALLHVDGEAQLIKGVWWNNCHKKEREKLAIERGHKVSSMKVYGVFATEKDNRLSFSYSHFLVLRTNKIKKADRAEWIQKIEHEGLTVKQLKEKLKPKKKKSTATVITAKQVEEVTEEQVEETLKANEATKTEEKPAPVESEKPTTIHQALEFFGLFGCTGITAESLEILYRGLAKHHHPDSGGSDKDMAKLTECRNIIKRIVK